MNTNIQAMLVVIISLFLVSCDKEESNKIKENTASVSSTQNLVAATPTTAKPVTFNVPVHNTKDVPIGTKATVTATRRSSVVVNNVVPSFNFNSAATSKEALLARAKLMQEKQNADRRAKDAITDKSSLFSRTYTSTTPQGKVVAGKFNDPRSAVIITVDGKIVARPKASNNLGVTGKYRPGTSPYVIYAKEQIELAHLYRTVGGITFEELGHVVRYLKAWSKAPNGKRPFYGKRIASGSISPAFATKVKSDRARYITAVKELYKNK